MTRIIGAVGAVLMAATLASAAYANPVQPTRAAAMVTAAQPNPQIRWHLEWQHHYNRHSEWVPGWVVVLNDAR